MRSEESKLGVVVGVNKYADPSIDPLRGCVNDSLLINAMLKEAEFKTYLFNNENATQVNILDTLKNCINKLNNIGHGYLVFWNSSHGYQVPDWSGDEEIDGLDEAICTYDTNPFDPLIDDKFYDIFSLASKNIKIFFGSDSCHSESLQKNKNFANAIRNSIIAQSTILINKFKIKKEPSIKLWKPPDEIFSSPHKINLSDYLLVHARKREKKKERKILLEFAPDEDKNILFAGACESDGISWDSYFSTVKAFHGAFTYCFGISVLEEWSNGSSISYKSAFKKTKEKIKDFGFKQIPKIEGSNDIQDEFVFTYEPK
ncbi:MAG: caspase family protein [Promethearchaeota archaeon]